jgi:tRNA pseudouridine(38-40) synthase
MPQQRYKLTLAYRGTRYHGWQKQLAVETYKGPKPEAGEGIPTIQETLAKSMLMVLRHPILVVGSSRTDSGVHAKAQVAHFDSDQIQIPSEGMRLAINHALPNDIVVTAIDAVPDNFDAIKWTISKRYQYFIWNHSDRPVFARDLAWHRWRPLDLAAMKAAAAHFQGEHDFTSVVRPFTTAAFRSAGRASSWALKAAGSSGTWCGSWSERSSKLGWGAMGRMKSRRCWRRRIAPRVDQPRRRMDCSCNGSSSARQSSRRRMKRPSFRRWQVRKSPCHSKPALENLPDNSDISRYPNAASSRMKGTSPLLACQAS